MAEHGVSERMACCMLGQHLSTQRKVPTTPDDEAALTADIVALAIQYGRYGYRRMRRRAVPFMIYSGRDEFEEHPPELDGIP